MMRTDSKSEVLQLLEGEIRRFETYRVARLHFSPELESRYERESSKARARILLVQGLFALLVYNCFLVGDYVTDPGNILRAIVVRLGVFTPLALLGVVITRRWRSATVRETAGSLQCLTAAASIVYLHHSTGSVASMQMQLSLTLVLLVMNCLMNIDLRYATAASLLLAAADAAWLLFGSETPSSDILLCGGILGWVMVLTLVANYSVSRERRFSYLLQLRGRLQRGLLAEANAELIEISSTDRLTGLPNRRAYDTRLHEVWAMALESNTPLSAVMVDVDHFKRLNDTYGHPYGDRVLQRVATLLQQALRGEEDFVARFGGEEFVTLLPDTDPAEAIKVAERIRTLVQVAGSPALQRDSNVPQDVWATVSCGVATVWPKNTTDASRLIADADAAMYRAKQRGRNRVCCASDEPLERAQSRFKVFPGMAGRRGFGS